VHHAQPQQTATSSPMLHLASLTSSVIGRRAHMFIGQPACDRPAACWSIVGTERISTSTPRGPSWSIPQPVGR